MVDVKEYLDSLNERYNCAAFIEDDPISVPHRYVKKEDVEIAAFLASTIAWGQRKTIVRNAHRMVDMMDDAPHQFITDATEADLKALDGFVHRTFNDFDFRYFVHSLQNIYKNYGGLGEFFESRYADTGDMRIVLSEFWRVFFELPSEGRTRRHLSSIDKGAACKRLNMFLKWMVRKDNNGVDLGIWNIPPSALYLPLDVHSGNTARGLGLLERRQSDWRAVEEVTARLREFDAADPVKYDFALFCAGIHKESF